MSYKHCEHCKGGYVLPGTPKGEMRDGAYFVAGSQAATAESESAAESKKKAIVLLTDIFGLPLVNSKIMADRFADSLGYDVWVPDQFGGWPIMEASELDGKLPQRPGEKLSLLTKLAFIWLLIKRIPRLIHSRPSVAGQRIQTFIKKLREERGYTRIGTVGYCFGGTTAIGLASTDLINSAVICHPGGFSAKQIAQFKVPTSWQCAEEDFSFTPKLRNETEAILTSQKNIEHEFCDYKGTVHGFAVRPNLDIPESKEGFEKTFEASLSWFKKTL
ncbi:hypothetical protein ACEPAF_9563 [Sanghuangporus sanghuang]